MIYDQMRERSYILFGVNELGVAGVCAVLAPKLGW
jgi:hypothetical protein